MIEVRPNISVVIPHYESVASVRMAITSVLEQTCLPPELIIVDDCSSDRSWQELKRVVEQYQSAFPKLILLRNKVNSGPASSRNRGWDEAKHQYVSFLDADDMWHPEKLKHVQMVIRAVNDVDFISHNAITGTSATDESRVESAKYNRIGLKFFVLRNPVATPAVTIRRDSDFRFPEGRRYSEDYELWLTMAVSGASMIHMDGAFVLVDRSRLHEGLSAKRLSMALGELQSLYRALGKSVKYYPIMLIAIFVSSLKSIARLLGFRPSRLRLIVSGVGNSDGHY